MKKEKIENILESIGLTNSESKVYLAILKLGETKVGEIIKESNVSSSKVHDNIEKLLKKGIISFILKNNIKYFYPSNPENLKQLIQNEKDSLEKKENNLNEILPTLNNYPNNKVLSQFAEVFIGLDGLKNAYRKLFEEKPKNKEFKFFYKYEEENVELVHKFFKKMDIEEYYEDISTKALFSEEYKKLFRDRKDRNKIKTKFTKSPIPSSVNIYNNKTLMISWSEKPIAYLIHSKEITKTNENLFDEVWNEN